MTEPIRLPIWTIRQVADNAPVRPVPMATDDAEHLAKVAGEIRASLLPGYYLDTGKGNVSE